MCHRANHADVRRGLLRRKHQFLMVLAPAYFTENVFIRQHACVPRHLCNWSENASLMQIDHFEIKWLSHRTLLGSNSPTASRDEIATPRNISNGSRSLASVFSCTGNYYLCKKPEKAKMFNHGWARMIMDGDLFLQASAQSSGGSRIPEKFSPQFRRTDSARKPPTKNAWRGGADGGTVANDACRERPGFDSMENNTIENPCHSQQR